VPRAGSQPGRNEVDPETAPAVVRADELAATGHSLSEIRAELLALGHDLTLAALARKLRQPIHRGVWIYGWRPPHSTRSPGGAASRDVPHLRLVPDELWHAAQAGLAARTRRRAPKGSTADLWPLVGLVRCASCGTALGRVPNRTPGQQKRTNVGAVSGRYVCLGARLSDRALADLRRSRCESARHDKLALEAAVWANLAAYVHGPRAGQAMAEAWEARHDAGGQDASRAAALAALAAAERAVDRWSEALEAADAPSAAAHARERLGAALERRDAARRHLAGLPVIPRPDFGAWIVRARQLVTPRQPDGPAYHRTLKALGLTVYVSDDGGLEFRAE
ncbi:MAG TPA: recombinase family protein, partial [Deinococcales bacterium]|nr:recombinase family protein [Deinococcales bacterium]